MAENIPREYVREYGTVAETIYHIILYRGQQFLSDFIMNLNFPNLDYMNLGDTWFVPLFMKKFFDKYDNQMSKISFIETEFEEDKRDKILRALPNDFEKLKTGLEDNLGNIHTVFLKYIGNIFEYVRVVKYFEIQFKIVEELMRNLFLALPRDVADKLTESIKIEEQTQRGSERQQREREIEKEKEIREKQKAGEIDVERKSRPRQVKPTIIKYFEIIDTDIINYKRPIIEFELGFIVLNEFEYETLLYGKIKQYEKEYFEDRLDSLIRQYESESDVNIKNDLRRDIEDLRKNIVSYNRKKRRVEIDKFRMTFSKEFARLEKDLIDTTQKIIGSLYRYEQDVVVKYQERASAFFIRRKK